jgi:uncharacterized protein (DUF39 family)
MDQEKLSVGEVLAAYAEKMMLLEARVRELAEADAINTTTMEMMTTTMETIMQQHTKAFAEIAKIFVGLGVDIQAPALLELRKIFNLPSPDEVN